MEARPKAAKRPAAETDAKPAPAVSVAAESAELSALRAELAATRAQLAAQQLQQAVGHVGSVGTVAGATHYVGIRNVSNYTVALPASPVPNEPPVTLFASTDTPHPQQRAVISYAWWLQIRNAKVVQEGFVVRDDASLGPNHQAGPVDDPADMPPGYADNVIDDPAVWLTSRDELQLRTDIAKITSEASIRRLQYTIDQQLSRIQAALPADTKDPKQRAEQAVMALPGKLKLAEELLHNRWIELTDRFRNV